MDIIKVYVLAFACLWPHGAARAASTDATFVNFEGKQTHPVRLSPDGTRLFAVNTPDARLSVFDTTNPSNPILVAEIPVGLEPVSVNPLNNEEAWVVNEVSDSVSVVSVSRGIVTGTLHAKDEPADVVFAAGRAFVSCSRNNLIRVFDLASHREVAAISLLGNNPRVLAVSPDGTKVYAAFALSGNRTTLIPAALAPAQPPADRITNKPPQVALIVEATDPAWSHVIQYQMPDHDVVEIDAQSLTVIRYFSGIGTVNLGLAVHPRSGDLFIANTDARNLVRLEANLLGHAVDNRLTRVRLTDGAVTAFDLNPGLDYRILPNPSALAAALAQPTASVFDSDGDVLYVAAFGTDRIARVDPEGRVLARIDVGPAKEAAADPRTKRGPRGLALHARAQRLYVLNRIANTVAIIDTASDTVLREIPVGGFDPTPAFIREGRGFLYDAKLSGNGTLSCASCHVDAEMDMLAWDLGDPLGKMETLTVATFGGAMYSTNRHPMKGPMVTQTFRGLKGLEPLHWRGDRASFLAFNGAFETLLGGTALASADMTAYRNFVHSIVFQPNPNQKLDRTLPAEFGGGKPLAGRDSFQSFVFDRAFNSTCVQCHNQNAVPQPPVGAGSPRLIMADLRLPDPQHIKVPHLRNLYQKVGFDNRPGATSINGFGFSHDGRDGLPDLFAARRFGVLTNDNPTVNLIKSNLVALLLCFDTGTAPAVGYSRTLTAAGIQQAESQQDWDLLEQQASRAFRDPFYRAAAVTNSSLVASGTIDGRRRTLLYQPATGQYRTDRSDTGPFTRAELTARIAAGDTLTLLGVPTVSALRMGLDRDWNGVPDGDEPLPPLSAVRSETGVRISWPDTMAVVLEASEGLSPGTWKTETNPQETVNGSRTLSAPAAAQARFYRLRRL